MSTKRPPIGCAFCWKGWKGYNTAGQLVACLTCRPHVQEYLQRWERAERTELAPRQNLDAPKVPMPDWFRPTAREFIRRQRERAAELTDDAGFTPPTQGTLLDEQP